MIASGATVYEQLLARLASEPLTWLVTGVAGFIGSNLLETLLKLDQRVVGLDNFGTGHRRNLDEVQGLVTPGQWSNFRFIEGDIRNLADCRTACEGIDYVLHQAALGSVPRSLEDPILTNSANITGFLNMLVAARDANVKSFTYAASSSTYGDHPALPKVEENIGKPLSPYAVTKYVNELYADVFARCYGFATVGLRYFNVFGPRQDPNGAYAAVIPKWTAALLAGETVYINGDGETSRDFCYVANAVQANLLAATADDTQARNQVYNVAVADRTTLNSLFTLLRDNLANESFSRPLSFPCRRDASASLPAATLATVQPTYRDFRAGDVRHSQADIGKARRFLGYAPTHRLAEGIAQALRWYVMHASNGNSLADRVPASPLVPVDLNGGEEIEDELGERPAQALETGVCKTTQWTLGRREAMQSANRVSATPPGLCAPHLEPKSTRHGFRERRACPSCGDHRTKLLFSAPFDRPPVASYIDRFYGAGKSLELSQWIYQLDQCRDCQLVFQRYIGDELFLEELYGRWLSTDNHQSNAEALFTRLLANPSATRDGHELMWISKYLRKPLSQLKTLDYGMGWALWARIAKSLGCQSFGFDLSKARMEAAAGHGIEVVDVVNFPEETFDFINTEQVFEHVADPLALINQLSTALRPGGVLKISVPNGTDILRRLQIGDWGAKKGARNSLNPVAPLEHINCFNKTALVKMGAKADLMPITESVFAQLAFLSHKGAVDLSSPKETLKNFIRPWYRFRNPQTLYIWLQRTA